MNNTHTHCTASVNLKFSLNQGFLFEVVNILRAAVFYHPRFSIFLIQIDLSGPLKA